MDIVSANRIIYDKTAAVTLSCTVEGVVRFDRSEAAPANAAGGVAKDDKVDVPFRSVHSETLVRIDETDLSIRDIDLIRRQLVHRSLSV